MATSTLYTPSGLQVPAITATQMREVDRLAVEELGPNLYQMMENAGRNLAEFCRQALGDGWAEKRIVVCAATGGNGGGGICAARHLANHGGGVTLVVADRAQLDGVPAEQLALFRHSGGRLTDVEQASALHADLIVDAVLGYSLNGAPHGVAAHLIGWMASTGAPIVSLDVPSGVDSSTGLAPGAFVNATTTMTLALPKQDLDGPAVGQPLLADIGVPRDVYRRIGVDVPQELFTEGCHVRLKPSVLDQNLGGISS